MTSFFFWNVIVKRGWLYIAISVAATLLCVAMVNGIRTEDAAPAQPASESDLTDLIRAHGGQVTFQPWDPTRLVHLVQEIEITFFPNEVAVLTTGCNVFERWRGRYHVDSVGQVRMSFNKHGKFAVLTLENDETSLLLRVKPQGFSLFRRIAGPPIGWLENGGGYLQFRPVTAEEDLEIKKSWHVFPIH